MNFRNIACKWYTPNSFNECNKVNPQSPVDSISESRSLAFSIWILGKSAEALRDKYERSPGKNHSRFSSPGIWQTLPPRECLSAAGAPSRGYYSRPSSSSSSSCRRRRRTRRLENGTASDRSVRTLARGRIASRRFRLPMCG